MTMNFPVSDIWLNIRDDIYRSSYININGCGQTCDNKNKQLFGVEADIKSNQIFIKFSHLSTP